MRVFLAMGPGDIVADHDRQTAGTSGRGETSITFSNQAVRLLRAGHNALLISSHARQDSVRDGDIESRNLPKSFAGRGGISFHLSQMLYALRLAREAKRFRADLAIIDSGTTHWFMLSAFRPARHSRLRQLSSCPLAAWLRAQGRCRAADPRPRRSGSSGAGPWRSWAVRRNALPRPAPTVPMPCPSFPGPRSSALPVSSLTACRPLPSRFAWSSPAVSSATRACSIWWRWRQALCRQGWRPGAFRCLWRWRRTGPLRQAVKDAGLSGVIDVRGRLERPALLAAYANSHAVIVPTRLGDFCEGMPLVCAEAMLAGRPVITSVLLQRNAGHRGGH